MPRNRDFDARDRAHHLKGQPSFHDERPDHLEDGKRPESRAGGGTSTAFQSADEKIVGAIKVAALCNPDNPTEKPSMSQFVRNMDMLGVKVIPSFQSSGRLNGFSYQVNGQVYTASSVGRAYTPKGLQEHLGIRYIPEQDNPVLQERAKERRLPNATTHERENPGPLVRNPERVRERDGLSIDQKALLREIGSFRSVSVHDLIRYQYQGRREQFFIDVRALQKKELVERRRGIFIKSQQEFDIVALTADGRKVARKCGQQGYEYYAKFVKPVELAHDLEIYRAYQKYKAIIEEKGGTVTGIKMDFEIKRNLYRALNKPGNDPKNAKLKREIASANDIKIVNGQFAIPDLRIEYRTEEGADNSIDIEVVTASYRHDQISKKQQAGMTLHVQAPNTHLGGRPWGPDLIGELTR